MTGWRWGLPGVLAASLLGCGSVSEIGPSGETNPPPQAVSTPDAAAPAPAASAPPGPGNGGTTGHGDDDGDKGGTGKGKGPKG